MKEGKIDHSTLPSFARKQDITTKTIDEVEVEEITETRDLGAMIATLTVAVQQLFAKVDALEKARDDVNYGDIPEKIKERDIK